MLPFSFSTPAAAAALFLTLLVSDVANSNNNKGRIFVQALPEFTNIGVGWCLDVSGNYYDNIGFQNGRFGAEISSKADCERLCVRCACEVSVSNANKQFHGFHYRPASFLCFCLFDEDGGTFTGNGCKNMDAGKDRLESPYLYFLGGDGTGEIDGTDGEEATAGQCSKTVTTFSTEDCPSDAPSESPSDAPSIVPSESTSPTSKASKRPKAKGPKASKTPKASSINLQTQEMKSGGSPSFSPLSAVGFCGTFAVIMFMFIDLI